MKYLILTICLLLNFNCFSQSQDSCEIPIKTKWVDVHEAEKCEFIKGKYKIQFFSTRTSCSKNINFPYFIETENCFKRYFFDKELSYCEEK